MSDRVVIVGAGVAGLVSALLLAARGLQVSVVERGPRPGGKMGQTLVEGRPLDNGPTVFTMRWVFDELFATIGRDFGAIVGLRPLEVLARHAWDEQARLDLFADEERSVASIGAFAGRAEAARYRTFCRDSRRVYEILEKPFLRAPEPGLGALMGANGLRGLAELPQIRPFSTLWSTLGRYFHDPRLRQLFGRYATYCGSSPFEAPATLMLVAHVEREGVWTIDGGMHRLATALADCAIALGATIRYDTDVTEVLTARGRTAGVTLAGGERIDSDAVILNADVAALAKGLFGPNTARAATRIPPAARSLSALTWSLVAKTEGFPLSRHTVFFSRDYRAEFDDILRRGALPSAPTVYVCAQDRLDDEAAIQGEERLLVLVNAPAIGDQRVFDTGEVEQCAHRTFAELQRCGLRIHRRPSATHATTPADFNRLFPATGGALYGRSSHGWMASFQRPGARTKIPGLYLAGGSTHPGPGVPMAALSGRSAAASLLADLTSAGSSRAMVMRGGTSTR